MLTLKSVLGQWLWLSWHVEWNLIPEVCSSNLVINKIFLKWIQHLPIFFLHILLRNVVNEMAFKAPLPCTFDVVPLKYGDSRSLLVAGDEGSYWP